MAKTLAEYRQIIKDRHGTDIVLARAVEHLCVVTEKLAGEVMFAVRGGLVVDGDAAQCADAWLARTDEEA